VLKVIELFAGIGTPKQALKELNIEHEIVATSEVDKFANLSYEAMHGKANNLGDISKIEALPAADLWFYGFCCQDISVAGKLAGIKEGTRSGLLLEVERLLNIANENGILPKYLVLENVKNLVGKRFKADFEAWLAFLSSLGYTNYWQILNTRDYCIPQNRERVFCVSIRGEHQPYTFPEKRGLRLRLKDMLDETVEEKFYLTERALKSLGHSNYNQERTRMQDADGVHRTLCQRDYKSPSCVQVGTLCGGKWDKHYKMGRRVYSSEGLSPTVHAHGGGNTHLKIVDDTYKDRPPREYGEVSPTIRATAQFKVVAGQFQPVNRDYNKDGEPRQEHFETRKDDVANAVLTGDRKNCVQIVAMRGRNPENPSDRTAGSPTVQRLEPNNKGLCNTLTSVAKDNLVLETPQMLKMQRNEYGKEVRKAYESGEISVKRSEMREITPRDDGVSNTLTTVQKDNLVFNHLECGARIRKLTPTECMRLQGWRDKQINKIKAAGISNAQIYRQAGNGITVTVLIALFGELFGVPYAALLDNWDHKEDNHE
jgi:DNA (cytosine-5)-methyltransferase 1